MVYSIHSPWTHKPKPGSGVHPDPAETVAIANSGVCARVCARARVYAYAYAHACVCVCVAMRMRMRSLCVLYAYARARVCGPPPRALVCARSCVRNSVRVRHCSPHDE